MLTHTLQTSPTLHCCLQKGFPFQCTQFMLKQQSRVTPALLWNLSTQRTGGAVDEGLTRCCTAIPLFNSSALLFLVCTSPKALWNYSTLPNTWKNKSSQSFNRLVLFLSLKHLSNSRLINHSCCYSTNFYLLEKEYRNFYSVGKSDCGRKNNLNYRLQWKDKVLSFPWRFFQIF